MERSIVCYLRLVTSDDWRYGFSLCIVGRVTLSDDGSIVDHDDFDNIYLLRFNAFWEVKYRHNSLLLRKQKPTLTLDIAIMSVGIEITFGRNKTAIAQSKLLCQQRPGSQRFMDALSKSLEKRGLDVKIIYSGRTDLDVLPKGAGKGQALAYLRKKLKNEGKLPVNTLVCGNSGNDAEQFSVPGIYGVMISNTQEELLQWHSQNAKDNASILHASERCAAGIIQAVGHFKLGPNLSPRDFSDIAEDVENASPGHESVKISLLIEKWRRAEVDNSELFLSGLKAVCLPSGVYIHPSGSEHHIREYINVLRNCYGDKQGKQFSVWVDGILATQICSDTWLVKFDKWESSGEDSFLSLIMSLP
ncbi:Sucrose-phosphatase 1 [Spatholobus suberectus]|nr:Sucrose-phosphatase 1 [Spatholobus suberectus]